MTFSLIGCVAGTEKPGGYRSSHSSPGYGVIYDRTYEAGYYAALWSKIEKPLIATILRDLGGAERTCLDFACGTGRITQVAADYFGKVVGVDVSASMLARAHGSDNVRLRRIDITRRRLGETFDVVTAFRFLLNAEQELRQEALQAIREHLKPEGRLICNIQMNATSPIGIAARIANRLPWSHKRNTMSVADLSQLLESAGFTVERTIGYGYLPRPGRLLPRFCEVCIEPAERLAAAARMPARCAQQFLVVAKRRENQEKESRAAGLTLRHSRRILSANCGLRWPCPSSAASAASSFRSTSSAASAASSSQSVGSWPVSWPAAPTACC